MAREQAGERRIEFDGATGRGAIVFDASRLEQARPEWFGPEGWGAHARPVSAGGRGSAWFLDAPFGRAVLRRYRRGGLVARLSRDAYLWTGESRVRSVAEFRLASELLRRGLPVPRPLAAWYERSGMHYRAALLMDRLDGVHTLAELADAGHAPWAEAGRLVALMHRAGLDHADLNAHNLMFDDAGRGWVIDLDRGRLRAGGGMWRRRNLERLHRSMMKLRGERAPAEVERDHARLRAAYEEEFAR